MPPSFTILHSYVSIFPPPLLRSLNLRFHLLTPKFFQTHRKILYLDFLYICIMMRNIKYTLYTTLIRFIKFFWLTIICTEIQLKVYRFIFLNKCLHLVSLIDNFVIFSFFAQNTPPPLYSHLHLNASPSLSPYSPS